MAGALSRDSFDYEKRGRIIGDDQHRAAIRARAREILKIDSGTARSRAGGAAPAPSASIAFKGRTRSNETVLKVVCWTKEARASMAQAKYVARTRHQDPPEGGFPMINEKGEELRGEEIAAEIRSWNLKSDGENLSPAARNATPEERASMPAHERLYKRQGVHLIFSVPAHARADVERLRSAVDLAARDTLGDAGFRYMYAIHTDHSARPHAHIVVKATSEPMAIDGRLKTRQLTLGPRELDAMRQVFTRYAHEQGLNVVATRREDRADLRADILDGKAPLRENMKMHQAMKQTRQGSAFERQAPTWYAEHGFAYERRRLAAASVDHAATVDTSAAETAERPKGLLARFMDRVGFRAEKGPSERNDAQDSPRSASKRGGYFENFENYRKGAATTAIGADAKILAHFTATHRDPSVAAESFKGMLREAPRLALWAANNHSIAFGEPTEVRGPGLCWREVKELTPARANSPHRVSTLGLDPILAGERARIREETRRLRSKKLAQDAVAAVGRSLNAVASRVEREAVRDPEAKERAAKIREISRDAADTTPPSPGRPHADAGQANTREEEKARLYKELDERLKARDQARARRHSRDRDDRGRDR